MSRDVDAKRRQSPFTERLATVYGIGNLFGMLVERGDLDEAKAIGPTLLADLAELRI